MVSCPAIRRVNISSTSASSLMGAAVLVTGLEKQGQDVRPTSHPIGTPARDLGEQAVPDHLTIAHEPPPRGVAAEVDLERAERDERRRGAARLRGETIHQARKGAKSASWSTPNTARMITSRVIDCISRWIETADRPASGRSPAR